MTWPMTLAGLRRAGAFSKPHDYKQNVQKKKGFLKKWVLTGKQFEDFRQKSSQIPLLPRRTKKTTTPQGRKLNMNQVATTKLSQAKLKKAFRIKLFELCKTTTKQSSPDLFNSYKISAGHDMLNNAGRATTCWRKLKAPWLQTKCTKNEGPSKKMSFNGKQFENFKPKKPKNPVIPWKTKQKNHKTPGSKSEHEPCSEEEINWSKIEKKTFRIKLFKLCKIRTKNSRPHLFFFL